MLVAAVFKIWNSTFGWVDFLIYDLGGIGGGSDVWKIVILGVHHWKIGGTYVLLRKPAASAKSSHKERCLTTN
jgi:hypothetical protein